MRGGWPVKRIKVEGCDIRYYRRKKLSELSGLKHPKIQEFTRLPGRSYEVAGDFEVLGNSVAAVVSEGETRKTDAQKIMQPQKTDRAKLSDLRMVTEIMLVTD